MKRLFIFAILSTSLLFVNCGTKEKQETAETPNDSIATKTIIIDTIAKKAVIQEAVITKNAPVETTTTVTTTTTKNPVKVVTKKTTDMNASKNNNIKVETKVVAIEQTKKVVVAETPAKVVIVEQPKTVTVTETPVKVTVQQPKVTTSISNWKIPAESAKIKSPIIADASAINAGKSLWRTNCTSCHGAKGLGDGPKAEKIDTSCGDFSSKEFQGLSDGELYYKTTTGKKPMPSYKEKLSNTDRWQLVAFMRTL
jgi:mono/diheme cytochrome c family protein